MDYLNLLLMPLLLPFPYHMSHHYPDQSLKTLPLKTLPLKTLMEQDDKVGYPFAGNWWTNGAMPVAW
jgi:hypothetical protein